MVRSIYWCGNCNVPVIGKKCNNCGEILTKKLPNPLKPVFEKEYLLYKKHMPKHQADNFSRILYRSRSYLISDISAPKAHYQIRVLAGDQSVSENKLHIVALISKKHRSRYRDDVSPFENKTYLSKLISANGPYLKELESEALKFIQDTVDKFPNHIVMCSFSGGKDSAVTAYLVKQVVKENIIVFSDTGIEYPETIKYIKEKASAFGKLVFLEQKNDFYALTKILGPPSRMMRWCCSTQKATPINNFQQSLKQPILSFDGIRKQESALRANYPRLKDNTKMIHQFSAYPILEWSEFEVWLYILWKKIPINPLYSEGFARIGCYPCPNNGRLDNFFMSYYHKEIADKWYKTLQNFALNIDESSEDYTEALRSISQNNQWGNNNNQNSNWSGYDHMWVEDGKWKGRRVKYENEIIGFISAEEDIKEEEENEHFEIDNETKPCLSESRLVITIEEQLPVNVTEFLKVFGQVKEKTILGKRFIEVESQNFKITYSDSSKKLIIKHNTDQDISKSLKLIVRQINKSLNCVNCGACVGSCPFGAISVNPSFKVDEQICTHCLTCTGTKYLKFSCVALHYKSNKKLIRFKKGNT